MITKAIIEELLDDGKQARVRIPFYDKVQGAADATLTKDLSIASTSILPGCYPVYNIGDIVFIAFEEDSLDKPVIIGLLYTSDNVSSSCDIKAQSLTATVNSNLPNDTNIDNANLNNDEILETYKTIFNSGVSKDVLDNLLNEIQQDKSDLSEHIQDKNNPHEVTKSQVGLGNVDNLSKSQMTGSISLGDTGFVTGGDVYDTIIATINASY